MEKGDAIKSEIGDDVIIEEDNDNINDVKEDSEVKYPDLAKHKVYPHVLYLDTKKGFLRAILLIAIFLQIPLYFICNLSSKQNLSLLSNIIAVIALAISSIDMFNRSKIFLEKQQKFFIIFVVLIVLYAVLIILSIYWYVSWEYKEFPILKNLFA